MIKMMLDDERLRRRGGECRVPVVSGKVVPTVGRGMGNEVRKRAKRKKKERREGRAKEELLSELGPASLGLRARPHHA
jgi:hypothetical protein